MDKMNPLENIYQKFKQMQDNIKVCWLAGGYKTREQYEKDLVENAQKTLEEIMTVELPEDQSWELAEYGYMERMVN